MALGFEIPHDEVERRRQQIRDLWSFRKLDHIPIMMSIAANPWGYSVTEQILDPDKQLQVRLESVRLSISEIPDDYIPAMRVDVGCIVLASCFGAEVFYGEHPDQTPYIRGPVIRDIDRVFRLQVPDPSRDGLMPQGLKMIKAFSEKSGPQIPVSLLDMGGPMNGALDILGGDLLFTAMHDHPEAVHRLLELLADTFILFAEESIKAAGGMDNITATDFPEWWQPEGKKGHMSDDVCSSFSPEFFEEFSIPVNSRIFERFGAGMMHNCGPHPAASKYLDQGGGIVAADIAYGYSKNDLPAIKRAFSKKGIVYLILEDSVQENLSAYRHAMEVLTPDVITVPCFSVTPKEDIKEVYRLFRAVSNEYAARVDWGAPAASQVQ